MFSTKINIHSNVCCFSIRAIDFRINTFYSNNVTVFADVVPVRLELSTTCLHVEPQVGLPADTGETFFKHIFFCVKSYVPREPRRDPNAVEIDHKDWFVTFTKD